ncbi:hypothetical protein DSECCO2_392420 [anaerobic digester metagenome]
MLHARILIGVIVNHRVAVPAHKAVAQPGADGNGPAFGQVGFEIVKRHGSGIVFICDLTVIYQLIVSGFLSPA